MTVHSDAEYDIFDTGDGARGIIHYTLDTCSPFDGAPSWQELHTLINGKKLMALRDAPMRARLIEEADIHPPSVDLHEVLLPIAIAGAAEGVLPPASLGAEAERRGISAAAAYIELLLETNGELVCTYRLPMPPS